jgi:hypothetical protein
MHPSTAVTQALIVTGRYLPWRLRPGRVNMASIAQDDAGGSITGFVIVFVSLIFRSLIPAPTWVWLAVLAVGILLAIKDGISGLDVVTLALAGFMIVGPLISGAYRATTDAADLEEPIPVPSGYGFELDPRSTNLEHLYESQPMPLGQAQVAAVDVANHYVDALSPEWTVIERDDRPPDLATVTLREGDSSRGISIFVGVVEPFGRPAFLDLRIQALVCGEDLPGYASGEVSCMTAPISGLVRYPGGERVVSSPHPSPGPLHEPVPVPPGYGFQLWTSSALVHEYQSTVPISFRDGSDARLSVLAYYRRVLDDWTVVGRDNVNLLVKAPDSTDGLAISVTESSNNGGTVLELVIRSITCLEDGSCSWHPMP